MIRILSYLQLLLNRYEFMQDLYMPLYEFYFGFIYKIGINHH